MHADMGLSGRAAQWCRAVALVSLCVGALALAADGPHFVADRPLDMQHIRLELAIDIPRRHVDGRAMLRMTPLRRVTTVKLDAVDFETHTVSLSVDGQAAVAPDYANDGRCIEILLEPAAAPGQELVITIDYALQNPKSGLHFFGPTVDDPDAPWQVWSQGETSDNRYWIPCFDEPNERQSTEILATVDASCQVLSNGRLAARHAAGQDERVVYHWVQESPHPAYLITLVVGQFHVHEEQWRNVPVTYWVPPDRAADVTATFDNTVRMLEFFSERIGVKYPWDQYAQVCCYQFGGGMENTSATTLGVDALCDATTRLDNDSDSLIAHELAHQWWGDLLTCREWPQLWLNEGFATYFEALWIEHDLGPDEFAHCMYQKAQGALADGKNGPIVERYYDNPWDLFNDRSYSKGACVLHMLRAQLGDEAFFGGLQRFCTAYANNSVETADLRRTLEDTTGRTLGRFFHDWTERPGHPVVDVAYDWQEETKLAEVTVRQTQVAPDDPQNTPVAPFHFPLTLEFTTGAGQAPVTVTQRITEREHRVAVPLPRRPTMVRVDPGHTLLMELTEHKGRDLWITQLTADPHVVGRLQALQHLVAEERSTAQTGSLVYPASPAPEAGPAPASLIVRLLADALRSEKFWAVQCEIARALGELGGATARDALLEVLASPHPRVRETCLEALRAFPDDEAVIQAVGRVLTQGDSSERVLSTAVTTYAELHARDELALLCRVLGHDRQRAPVQERVLETLGEHADAPTLSVLVEWTQSGKPRTCRQTALAAVARATARLAEVGPLEPDVIDAVLGTVNTNLRESDARLRNAAAHALGELAAHAGPSRGLLKEIAEGDPSETVRNTAKEALQNIPE